MKNFIIAFAAAIFSSVAMANVIVSPASVANYEYFPVEGSFSSGGGGASGLVDAHNQCYYSPKIGDVTLEIDPNGVYGMESINFYFMLIGGDGGAARNGGGGGSSAVVIDGAPFLIAKGGDGGSGKGTTVSGSTKLSAGQKMRLVTGGGGGNGATAGGGGGAGWRGGGAGSATAPGMGGGTSAGAGGSGSMPGSSGSGHLGGVSSYPDGTFSSLTVCPADLRYNQSRYTYGSGQEVWQSNFAARKCPASLTMMGAYSNPCTNTSATNICTGMAVFSGGGGGAGMGGGGVVSHNAGGNTNFTFMESPTQLTLQVTWGSGGVGYFYYNYYTVDNISRFPDVKDMSFTRQKNVNAQQNSTGYTYSTGTGSLPGQIVIRYGAPGCNIFK